LQKHLSKFLIGRSVEIAVIGLCLLLGAAGCGRQDQGGSPSAAQPTVASLSPAATDLIIGIGGAGHLVAVSDYDEDRPGATGLPRIGDFDHVDWEKLAAAGPKILVTQFGNRMPADLVQRCADLGIKVIDVRLDNVDDIYHQADILGDALGVHASEKTAVTAMQAGLSGIADQVKGLPKVRAVIAIFDGGSVGLIGPGRFHDDLLTIAGGVNAAAGFHNPYVMVDGEELTAIAPDVIFDLEPIPPTTPQQIEQDKRYWDSLPDIPAVKNGQVYRITDPWGPRPGWHAVELTRRFARELHGD
jgi:iron complex transport system substrate-binding protein